MEKTVVALYDHLDDAQSVVEELVRQGFPREQISLIAKDAGSRADPNAGREVGQPTRADSSRIMDEESTMEDDPELYDDGDAAAKGAGIGAALGGIAGLVVGLGAFVIPGVGPILAAGPLLSVLSGLGIGAVTGGMIGALTDSGVDHEDAHIYMEGVRRGGLLVLVHAPDDRADLAANIMNRYHPANLQERSEDWRKEDFQGFSDSGEAFIFDQKPKRPPQQMTERAPDQGRGARTYAAQKPPTGYDSPGAGSGHPVNKMEDGE